MIDLGYPTFTVYGVLPHMGEGTVAAGFLLTRPAFLSGEGTRLSGNGI